MNYSPQDLLIVKTHDVMLDSDYVHWIYAVKLRFRKAQIKTAIKVNSEQLLFNWQMGRDLVVLKAEETWGSGIVEQISLDLQNEFPEVKGFSARNLWNMKKWYLYYASNPEFDNYLQTLEQEIEVEGIKLQQVGAEIQEENPSIKLQQIVAEIPFPRLFSYVPWGHHIEIITKCKSVEEALFYIRKTIEEGWSRNTLVNCLKADLFHTIGSAVTNFREKLPEAQSKLAQSIIKDTYDLSFVSLPQDYDENSLETALEQNITRFLLELGTGFAFVGRQKEIVVSGKTRKIDMLFYHIRLRCYVVIELKAESFEPEFTGKLNFYVNAVNELIKSPDDQPTIGLLICRDKDQTEVKWAFQGIQTPMGVASYDNIQIQKIQAHLPTADQIRHQIDLAEEEFRVNSKKDR